jgi:dihydroxyacetone kinase-like predicted kinase
MGRTFKSVRMGSQEVAQRWFKASRALSKEDQIYGQKLAEMIKMHSSEAFYALDDPLEAAIFSVLIELVKEADRKAVKKRDYVDL